MNCFESALNTIKGIFVSSSCLLTEFVALQIRFENGKKIRLIFYLFAVNNLFQLKMPFVSLLFIQPLLLVSSEKCWKECASTFLHSELLQSSRRRIATSDVESVKSKEIITCLPRGLDAFNFTYIENVFARDCRESAHIRWVETNSNDLMSDE